MRRGTAPSSREVGGNVGIRLYKNIFFHLLYGPDTLC